jgi:carbamoyltransferase
VATVLPETFPATVASAVDRATSAPHRDTAPAVVGISGARRSPAAAVALGGRLAAFCEQERLTRIRGTGLRAGEVPSEAVGAVLASVGAPALSIGAYVTAEDGIRLPPQLPRVRLEHHCGHAATAFLTSGLEHAAVLVCDQSSSPDVSVWLGRGPDVTNLQWPWTGEGFASLFSQAAEMFGFGPGQEHRLEALARVAARDESGRLRHLVRYENGGLQVAANWKDVVAGWLGEHGRSWSVEHGAIVASAFQRALGEALLALVADIRRSLHASRLCLGGGLFYNTFLNTLVSERGGFDDVFVAPNPGNAGLAAGAALAVSRRDAFSAEPQTVSPFLGPDYPLEDMKGVLDSCKLSYDCLSYGEVVAACVDALVAGRLVGWFQGRMEWAHRALGNRSILANPLSPYVLDNLNTFLKRREGYRAYSLSVRESQVGRYFDGPPRSRWMEYEYRVRDTDTLKHALPEGATSLRVQTVDADAGLFADLHAAFEAATGHATLVNTSFNGFSEPIVCSPRDAIRVFYGTGLDMLVLGRFVLRK